MKIKQKYSLLLTLSISVISFSAERPPQPIKKGVLDVLPAELRLELIKANTGFPLTLDQSLANIKRYYLAHPQSQQSVGITKAILTHLMNVYHLEPNELQKAVDSLSKRETMTVFQNNEMKQWIEQQKETLNKNKDLILAVEKMDKKEVENLLAQGAQANAYHRTLITPLFNAFSNYLYAKNEYEKAEAFKIIELLVNAGANSISLLWGALPLSRAVFVHSIPLVTLLLQAGQDPNFHNENQPSPLANAIYFLLDALENRPYTQEVSERKTVLRLLLDAGANPNAAGYFPPSKIYYSTIKELINLLPQFTPSQKDMVINEIYKEH